MAELAITLAVIAMLISMLGLLMLALGELTPWRVERAVPYTLATGVATVALAVISLLAEIVPKMLGAFNG